MNLMRIRYRGVVLTLSLALAVTTSLQGCVSTAGSASMSPAEQQLRSIETTRLTQGIATGAIAGALVGGLLAAATGGNGRQIAAGAGVGALAGGAMGATYADNVNQQARPYAQANTNYEAMIARANANIASYGRVASVADRIRQEEKGRITHLNARLARGEITAAGYRQELSNARGNIRVLEQQIDNASADLAQLDKAARDGAPVGRQRDMIAQQKSNLETRRAALAAEYDRVPDSVGLDL